MHLVTYASDDWRARFLRVPATNICSPSTSWTGDFRDKVRAVRSYVQHLPDDDLVCCVDAYDVVATALGTDLTDALRTRFDTFEADVVFSAETNCFPWAHVRDMYPFHPSPYRFLNSGGYIGRAKALRTLLDAGELDTSPCDQGFFTYLYITNPISSVRIALDTRCEIFQCMYGVPWSHLVVTDGVLANTYTDTHPLFVHFNGQQFLMTDDASILPILVDLLDTNGSGTFGAYTQKHPPRILTNPAHARIADLARRRASTFVLPNQDTIGQRDWDNQHAIFCGHTFETTRTPKDHNEQFGVDIRAIVQPFLAQVGSSCAHRLDMLLHDYLGPQHTCATYPHSVLGFSTHVADTHNVPIPDRYAMQRYRGMLDQPDHLPTVCKHNRLLFIGSSTGKLDHSQNARIRLAKYASTKDWIDAWLSEVVNVDPRGLEAYTHAPMSLDDQRRVRHLVVVDGNTACWDRLPWILASKSVCWKMASDHQCWYEVLLEPWVHYIPCTLDSLESTWERVREDEVLQRRIVRAANTFAAAYLTHEAHCLYMRVLLDELAKK